MRKYSQRESIPWQIRFDKYLPNNYLNHEECWIWQGSQRANGYGAFWIGNDEYGHVNAHRASWLRFKGGNIKGICVLHKCDTPMCVNPNHLFLGTNKENTQDMIKKGRKNPALEFQLPHTKLSNEEVEEIKKKSKKGFTNIELAREYDVCRQHIGDIVRGRRRQNEFERGR